MNDAQEPTKNKQPLRLMKPGGIPYVVPPKQPLSAAPPSALSAPPPERVSSTTAQKHQRLRQLKAKHKIIPVVPRPVPITHAKHVAASRRGASPLRRAARHTRVRRSLIFIGLLLLGPLVIQSLQVGELVIAIYATVALTRKIESTATFTLALLALLVTILMMLINPNVNVAANFATYAFLLLAVGIILQTLELRHDTKETAQ